MAISRHGIPRGCLVLSVGLSKGVNRSVEEDAVESAVQYVSEGYFGDVPQTLHEKAVHLIEIRAHTPASAFP